MSQYLNNLISSLVQSTGANSGTLSSPTQRSSFLRNVKADIARIVSQHNNVVYPVFRTLRSGPTRDDAIALGIEGRTITTFGAATASGAECYWNSTIKAPASIKETIDTLISELSRLENLIAAFESGQTFDDTSIWQALYCLQFNDAQLAKDAFGTNYGLDCDGNDNLTYPLAQHLDAIGAFFNNYPGTGLTYPDSYPSLQLQILSSEIAWQPSTVPMTSVIGLNTSLQAIVQFTGMASFADNSPNYGAHVPALTWISNGDSLEKAIALLDQKVETITGSNVGGGAEVFKTKTLSDLIHRTIVSSDASISVSETANTIDLKLAGGPPVFASDYLVPEHFIAAANAPITLRPLGGTINVQWVDINPGNATTEMSVSFLEFTLSNSIAANQRIMATRSNADLGVGSPLRPTTVRVELTFALPSGYTVWGGAGGGISFDLDLSESTVPLSAGVLSGGMNLAHNGGTWTPAASRNLVVAPGAADHDVWTIDFGLYALDNNSNQGIVNLRIQPQSGSATGDFLAGDAVIWLIGARLTWS
jgi:hypothetical protein